MRLLVLGLVACSSWPFATRARAQVPSAIGYQGKLLNADGSTTSGVVQMTFTIYNQPTNGTSLWFETQSVPLSEGFYAVLLGSVNPIPASAFDGTTRYLDVAVGGTSLTPRQALSSVPYAYQAQTIVGGPVVATQISVGSQPIVDATGQLVAGAGSAFAPRVHTHDAGDIVSGVLGPVRGGTGVSGPTATGQVLRASASGQWSASLLVPSDLPDLSTTYLPLAGGTLTGQLVTPAAADSAPAVAVGGDSSTGLTGSTPGTLVLVVAGVAQASLGTTTSTLNAPGALNLRSAQDLDLSTTQGNLNLTASQGNLGLTVSQGNFALKLADGNATVTATAGGITLNAGDNFAAQGLTASLKSQTTASVTAATELTLDAPLTQMPGVATFPVSGSAVVISSGGLLGVLPSARRFKEDIQDIGDRSDALWRLRPVAFRYRHDVDAEQGQRYGLIAEEVDAVDPQLVVRDAHGEILTVRYDLVNALLLNAAQQDHAEIERQAAQLNALAARLAALEAESHANR